MSGVRYARIPPRIASKHDLRGTDLRVLIAIASFADEAGRAFPGMTTIASIAGISRSDVPRSVRRLVAAGIMRRDTLTGGASTNSYMIIFGGEDVSTGADSTGAASKDADSTDTTGVLVPVLQSVRTRTTQPYHTITDQLPKKRPARRPSFMPTSKS